MSTARKLNSARKWAPHKMVITGTEHFFLTSVVFFIRNSYSIIPSENTSAIYF
jgi:hypothetical protein